MIKSRNMFSRRMTSIVTASVLAAAATVAMAPTAAQAAPIGCASEILPGGSAVSALCLRGTGSLQAIATCKVNVSGTSAYKVYSYWANINGRPGSVQVKCGAHASAIDHGYETRD